MGRSGIRRRKPARHLRKIPGPLARFGATEHSPWTVEGRIEAIGVMGRGVRDASEDQQRYFGRLVRVTLVAIVVLLAATWLIGRIF